MGHSRKRRGGGQRRELDAHDVLPFAGHADQRFGEVPPDRDHPPEDVATEEVRGARTREAECLP